MKEKWSIYYWITDIVAAIFTFIGIVTAFKGRNDVIFAVLGCAAAFWLLSRLILRFLDELHKDDK